MNLSLISISGLCLLAGCKIKNIILNSERGNPKIKSKLLTINNNGINIYHLVSNV